MMIGSLVALPIPSSRPRLSGTRGVEGGGWEIPGTITHCRLAGRVEDGRGDARRGE